MNAKWTKLLATLPANATVTILLESGEKLTGCIESTHPDLMVLSPLFRNVEEDEAAFYFSALRDIDIPEGRQVEEFFFMDDPPDNMAPLWVVPVERIIAIQGYAGDVWRRVIADDDDSGAVNKDATDGL